MASDISFVIPESVAEEDFGCYFKQHVDLYRLALDLTGDNFDRRSQVDRLEIGEVELESSKVTVHYTVEYSGFRPCQDLRYSEAAKRNITGRRNGREFRFTTFQALERRSTWDEF